MLGGLAALVNQSLVRQDPVPEGQPRFVILETIREYALERLAQSGEIESIRRQHARYYLDLAERADAGLRGPDVGVWLTYLSVELGNLRSAMRWCEAARDVDTLLRLAGALGLFWAMRGHATEGRGWLEGALAASSATSSIPRAEALLRAASLASRQQDHAEAERWATAGLDLWQQLGDKRGIAASFNTLGVIAIHRGDFAAARRPYEQSLTLFTELGDKEARATALMNLGELAHMEGELEQAANLIEEAISLERDIRDPRKTAIGLALLGEVRDEQADPRSSTVYREALQLFDNIGDDDGLAGCFLFFACRASACGSFDQGARLFGAEDRIRAAIAEPLIARYRDRRDRAMREAREGLGETAFAAAYATGKAMLMQEAVACAFAVDAAMSITWPKSGS